MAYARSVMVCQMTCLILYGRCCVQYGMQMKDTRSVLVWQILGLFWYNRFYGCFGIADARSVLVWQMPGLFWYDSL